MARRPCVVRQPSPIWGCRSIQATASSSCSPTSSSSTTRLEQRLAELADELSLPRLPIQSYLANFMRLGSRSTPYSTVVAIDFLDEQPWSSIRLSDGASPRRLADDETYLTEWVAEDLGAAVGDTVEFEYFVVGAREELTTRRSSFRVVGIADMTWLAVDPELTPEYPGLQDAEDMADWDPPFPVDLDAIRDKDEQFWDDYESAPKAFVSAGVGRELWSTRFGATTSLRLGSDDAEADAQRFEQALLQSADPEEFGLILRPVKQLSLEAAKGPSMTNFAGLFASMSIFLIVAAVLLVGLLFGLGVEQRAKEVGLRLAIGTRMRRIRRGLMAEGLLLSAVGGLLGLALGVAYAWLLLAALRTIWKPAVGTSALYLHVQVPSLIAGWVMALIVVALAIYAATRRLRRIPPPALLAGRVDLPGRSRTSRRARWIAVGGLLLGLGLVAVAFVSPAEQSTGLAFGSAMALLVAGLAAFADWCRHGRSGRGAAGLPSPLWGTAARNSSWNPGRSILSVALVAFACFMIVAVGANRGKAGDALERRDSPTGGFGLVGESAVPVLQSLDRAADRRNLGFDPSIDPALDAAELFALRLLPGDDASCLNLYRPNKPRVLGVPDGMIQRGGFAFMGHLPLEPGEASPWDLLRRDLGPNTIPTIADGHSAQWILELPLGGELEIEDEFGASIRLRLVGMLQTGIFQSELLIGEAPFLNHFPGRSGYRYFLIDSEAAGREELALQLERTLEPFGLDMTTTREKIASFKVVENTYISTFQTLGGLGLLLGTVGLAVVMMRNVLERRRELATLRAFGYRRRRLAWMVLAENAFLLFAGMGLGAGAALVSVAPRLTQIAVPWDSLAVTLAAVAVVGMLASLLAVRAAGKVPLIPALKAD